MDYNIIDIIDKIPAEAQSLRRPEPAGNGRSGLC